MPDRTRVSYKWLEPKLAARLLGLGYFDRFRRG
jgi:hypothetical protein